MGSRVSQPACLPRGRSNRPALTIYLSCIYSYLPPNKASTFWTAVRYCTCSHRYVYGVGRYGNLCTCTATSSPLRLLITYKQQEVIRWHNIGVILWFKRGKASDEIKGTIWILEMATCCDFQVLFSPPQVRSVFNVNFLWMKVLVQKTSLTPSTNSIT